MTNSNELRTFDFNGLELHILIQGGEPWFAGKDVCTVLRFSNSSTAYARLSGDERSYVARTDLGLSPGKPMVFLSESGLYKLIMRSDKPEARKFQDWVTREVLPAIRKTGGYLLNEEARETAKADDRQAMPLPEEFAQLFQQLLKQQAENTRLLKEQTDLLTQLLAEREASRAVVKVKKDTRMISAAIAKERFGLPGETSQIGWAATLYCTERGINYRKRRNSVGTNAYPAFIFAEIYETA